MYICLLVYSQLLYDRNYVGNYAGIYNPEPTVQNVPKIVYYSFFKL